MKKNPALSPEQMDAMSPAEAVEYARKHFGPGVGEVLKDVLDSAEPPLPVSRRDMLLARYAAHRRSQYQCLGVGACCLQLLVDADCQFWVRQFEAQERWDRLTDEEKRAENDRILSAGGTIGEEL